MVSLGSFREQPLWATVSGLVPAQVRAYRPSIPFAVCAVMLAASLLLGGGTRGGFLSDAILQLLAIPALLMALTSLADLPIWRTGDRTDAYWVLAFCFALALVPLIQLAPLPPWLWTRLPGREPMAHVFGLIGDQLPWMPISVSPHETWLSFVSLLPPMAIFLAAIQTGYRERRALSAVIIVLGVVSVFLGLLQVAQGQNSALRFFAITNPTEAVGFFANRNHFAALLYAVLLFTAVWAIDIGFRVGSWTDIRSFETAGILWVTAIFVAFIVILAGEGMARSRAGLALTIAAMMAVFALASADRRNVPGARPSKLLIAATILALILTVQFALYRILGRFATDPLENARAVFAHNTLAAAKSFLPFGSGLGTFVPVYAMFERPIDAIANTYANHAHDDVLEWFLETGIMGVVLFCIFLVWWAIASVKLWWKPPQDLSAFDSTLGRAAAVVILLLLAHSFFDYPMRTAAIEAIFAVSCALLVEPLRHRDALPVAVMPAERERPGRRKPSLAPVESAPPAPLRHAPVAQRPREAGGRWGEGLDWPAEWRSPPDAGPRESRKQEPEDPKTQK